MIRYLRSAFLFLCASALFACTTDPTFPPGVLAVVNGQAITLAQVEAYHEANGSTPFTTQEPSVRALQEQYGSSLGSLIVLTLLEQELDRRNLTITQEDVDVIEMRVRNEYPPDMFDTMLQTEFIGLPAWRELLKWRLQVERFNAQVLRPTIVISSEEIQAMYLKEQALFSQPARVRLLIISGSKAVCEVARKTYIRSKKVMQNEARSIDIEHIQLAESRMPRAWLKHIQNKPVGTITPVFKDQGAWSFCVIQERMDASTFNIAESYTLFETLVLETKLTQAFEDWFLAALDESKIFVSQHLRESNALPDDISRTTSSGRPTKALRRTNARGLTGTEPQFLETEK